MNLDDLTVLSSCFFFSSLLVVLDDSDRRQLTTSDTLEQLGNVLQFFLHFVLATHEGSYNPTLDVEVNIHEVATQDELGDELDNGC